MLLSSLIQASSEYDTILQARASKPFLTELLVGVGLSFLPEFKFIGRIAKRYVPKVTSTLAIRALSSADRSSLENWEVLAGNILAKTNKVDRGIIHLHRHLTRHQLISSTP